MASKVLEYDRAGCKHMLERIEHCNGLDDRSGLGDRNWLDDRKGLGNGNGIDDRNRLGHHD